MIDPEEPLLNLKQAAALLGVHYMTVYRYVRQGRLDATRDGTEWRVSSTALAGLRDAVDELDEIDGGSWAARLERCLLAGDEVASWRVIESALAAARSPQYCYVDMVAKSLSSIGARWADGELSIADQFLATAVATRIVARLGARFRRPGRSRGVLVFGAPSGELHSLPVALAADLVRLAGFSVLELGANAPPDAFASVVQRTARLVAVGIGITTAEHVPAARDVVDAVRSVDSEVPIILGGQGAWDPTAAVIPGVTAWALSGTEVAETVSAIAGRTGKATGRA